MLNFPNEFFFGVFIGFILSLLLNDIIWNSQLYNMEIFTKIMKSRKIYSPDIETLWNDLRQLYDKRIESAPKFSFNKMAFEIYKLLDKQKAIAASTIRNFYLRRTTPRKKTIEAIQRWIDEEKKGNVNHADEEIDNSDSQYY